MGSNIIDHGDGSYEYALPANADIQSHWSGPFLLEYEGQTQYTWDEDPWPSSLLIWDEDLDLSDVDMALDMVIEDEHHSQWRVVDHDQAVWDGLVSAYSQEMDLEYGPEVVGAETHDPQPPGLVEVHPFTWTETDCDGDGGIDQSVWDAEDRAPFFSPPSARMAKTVVLFRDISPPDQPPFSSIAGGCSGVLVDDNVLLTAQHCVVDVGSNPLRLNELMACTQGNEDVGARCSSIRSSARPRRFNAVSNSDWALLGLTTNLGTGNSMALSRASANIVEAEPAFNSGYPAHLNNGCGNNPFGFAGGTVGAVPHRSGFWHSATGTDLTRTMTRTHLDGAVGQSGSPIYYYPGGCCGANFVTGVLTGYRRGWPASLEDGWVTGPRVSTIRPLLIGLLPRM